MNGYFVVWYSAVVVLCLFVAVLLLRWFCLTTLCCSCYLSWNNSAARFSCSCLSSSWFGTLYWPMDHWFGSFCHWSTGKLDDRLILDCWLGWLSQLFNWLYTTFSCSGAQGGTETATWEGVADSGTESFRFPWQPVPIHPASCVMSSSTYVTARTKDVIYLLLLLLVTEHR